MPRMCRRGSCLRPGRWRICDSPKARALIPVCGRATRFRPHYDPMIAKIITHGATRAGALRRLSAALRDREVAGTVTNLAFLGALAGHRGFCGRRSRHRADCARHRQRWRPRPRCGRAMWRWRRWRRLACWRPGRPRSASPFGRRWSGGCFCRARARRSAVALRSLSARAHDVIVDGQVIAARRSGGAGNWMARRRRRSR